MTELALFVLFGFVSHNRDFLCLAVLYDLCCNGCTCDVGRTYGDTVIISDCDNLIEGVLALFVGAELFNVDNIACFYFILLAACFDNCVHLNYHSFLRLAIKGLTQVILGISNPPLIRGIWDYITAIPCCQLFFAAVIVFLISIVIVIGPTPPGTGVI